MLVNIRDFKSFRGNGASRLDFPVDLSLSKAALAIARELGRAGVFDDKYINLGSCKPPVEQDAIKRECDAYGRYVAWSLIGLNETGSRVRGRIFRLIQEVYGVNAYQAKIHKIKGNRLQEGI